MPFIDSRQKWFSTIFVMILYNNTILVKQQPDTRIILAQKPGIVASGHFNLENLSEYYFFHAAS